MDLYSTKKDYERAAIYRDKVQSIRDTQKRQNVLTGFDDLDIFKADDYSKALLNLE